MHALARYPALRLRRSAGVLVLVLAMHAHAAGTSPAPAPADEKAVGSAHEAPRYRVDAFVRVRYRESWVSVSPRLRSLIEQQLPDPGVSAASLRAVVDTARASDGFSPTRAEVALHVQAGPALKGELRVDWARLLDPEQANQGVRELAGVWSPSPAVSLTAGIFALPFSLHELFEQRSFELADEGPSHQLLEHLRYYGRDTGVMVGFRPLPRADLLSIDIAATEGGAIGAQDYRGPGLLVGRVSASPIKALELSTAVSFRPRPLDAWWEELRYRYRAYDRGAAVAATGALLFEHWTLRAEWLTGKRTDNDVRVPVALRRGDARSFAAAWMMATARVPVGSIVLEPAARGEWLDTDREHRDVGELIHLSFGLSLDFNEHARVSAELSRHLVQPGTRDWNFDVLRYQTDATSGSLQLQLGI